MTWAAQLSLHCVRDGERTVSHHRHAGPLRLLRTLYPEGPGIAHHVVVHPPGGIVGGDTLAIEVRVDAAAQALVTTPGATRWYRSDGAAALQTATLLLADDARLEWLPLETIAYPGCNAESRVVLQLQPRAQVLGWDILALGLPAAGQHFDRGRYRQHLELPGSWLERGSIDGSDAVLLDCGPGLAGHRVAGTLWFAGGQALSPALRDALLDAARSRIAAVDALPGGMTSAGGVAGVACAADAADAADAAGAASAGGAAGAADAAGAAGTGGAGGAVGAASAAGAAGAAGAASAVGAADAADAADAAGPPPGAPSSERSAAPPGVLAGATATHAPLVVVRALAHRVEPLMALFQAVRGDWRGIAWDLAPHPPRIWRV